MQKSSALLLHGKLKKLPLKIDATNASELNDDDLSLAVDEIRNGGVFIFPTDTVYGIGVNAENERSILKIYELKKRPANKPLILLFSSIEEVEQYVEDSDSKIAEILKRLFWPGPLTLIFKKSSKVIDSISSGQQTVGVRIPENEILRKIIKLVGVPIASTSANITEEKSPVSLEEVPEELIDKAEVIIDGGACKLGTESTIVDVTIAKPIVIREGTIKKEQIYKIINRVVSDMEDG